MYFYQIKNLILICVKENKLVDAEYSKKKFSKDLIFIQKKYRSNLQRNINKWIKHIFEWSLTFAASVDVNKIIYILIRESVYQYINK